MQNINPRKHPPKPQTRPNNKSTVNGERTQLIWGPAGCGGIFANTGSSSSSTEPGSVAQVDRMHVDAKHLLRAIKQQ